ncbi:MAG: YceI family protein [Polyangiaceae bacterium]|jgi:polyisoprenoid-binding protein YceI
MKLALKFSVTAVSIAVASISVAAYAAFSSPRDARVAFAAAGPAGLKIEGATSELKVLEEGGNVVVDVPLANLATGIALRDQHMKEKYLEVAKYPDAALTVARSALKVPASGGQLTADAPGTLKLHGQERPVTVRYDAASDADGLTVHGKLHIRMDEFGIAIPSYLGVTVKPEVDITASFHVAGS